MRWSPRATPLAQEIRPAQSAKNLLRRDQLRSEDSTVPGVPARFLRTAQRGLEVLSVVVVHEESQRALTRKWGWPRASMKPIQRTFGLPQCGQHRAGAAGVAVRAAGVA